MLRLHVITDVIPFVVESLHLSCPRLAVYICLVNSFSYLSSERGDGGNSRESWPVNKHANKMLSCSLTWVVEECENNGDVVAMKVGRHCNCDC